MEYKQNNIMIEIIHSIKDIIVTLIDRTFPIGRAKIDEYEEVYKQ